ncbi:MAG: peptidylprolyl isomerase [Chitinophagales bacterium]
MKMKMFACLLMIAGSMAFLPASAQSKMDGNEVLFTVNGQPVTKEEFLYVYKKNNPDKQGDFSEASLQDYLDLYINFKLKVMEARAEKIDTTEKVREELQKYGDQLIKSNFDKEVLEAAALKTYNQMKTERLVYHVMIMTDKNTTDADTTAIIAKLNAARARVVKGEDFGKVAREVSTDNSYPNDPGLVGWITTMQINDENFEHMAFSTAVGGISPVFKTRFGYHFVMVKAERPASGTVTVEHILVKTPKDAKPEQIAAAKMKADSLMGLLKNGAVFEDLAKTNSDDKMSAVNGGRLEPFGVGKMVYNFQEAAFALKNPGDITGPVQTSYGFHIIKLMERKPFGTYDEMKDEIKGKIERSGEYAKLRSDFVANVKTKYPFTENMDAKKAVYAMLDSSFLTGEWKMPNMESMQKTVFSIGDRKFTEEDLASYMELNQRANRDHTIDEKFGKLYDQAMEQTLIEYDLAARNIDFKRLLQEYRDGLPLFAMLEKKIWSKGSTDSTGLANFYEAHKADYMWPERVEATIYKVPDATTDKAVRKMAKKNVSDKDIMAKYNTDSTTVVTVKTGLYLPGQDSNVDNMNKTIGTGGDILNADGTITFVRINKVVPPTNKTLDEARGYVISAYQDYLEKQWIAELHAKYPVKVNEDVFKSMVR